MNHSADIGVDLGNSKFSLCVRGEGVVASEPAYIAYRGSRATERSLVAVGNAAREMYEKAPRGLTVARPMQEGIVVDCHTAGMILVQMARKAGLRWQWSKPRVYVGALFGASSVETKAFADVAEMLGRGRPEIVREPLAAANAILDDVASPKAHLVVDVGDGATEAMVISQGRPVLGTSIRFGGATMENQLMEFLRRRYQLVVSRTEARRIKEEVSTSGASVAVRGVMLPASLPREIRASKTELEAVFASVADHIAASVCDLLSRIPPEVAVDLYETGLKLCGSASLAPLVAERLAEETRLAIHPVASPGDAVVRGLGRMLDHRYA